MKKSTFNSTNIWKIIFLYLIFQPSVAKMVTNPFFHPVLNYSDEVLAVILVFFVVARNKFQVHLLAFERRMMLFLAIFEFIGIACGLYYQYQETWYMFVDAFTCIKFIIYYYAARILTKGRLTDKYFFSINKICKILAVAFFILMLHEILLTPWWPVHDTRYFGIDSVKLFFGHPESLARASMQIMFVLAYNSRYFKNNKLYMLALTVVVMSSQRTKAMVAVFAFYAIYFYFIRFRFRSKLPIGVAGIAGAAYIGYDSFSNYYITSSKEAARRLLTEDSVSLANSYFPWGTGFGSYGSSMAAQYYSDLYVKLGYLNIPDVNKNSKFLSDTFYPILIAQTGWLGTGAFALAMLQMIVYIINSSKKDIYFFWIAASIIIYDIISSFAAPAFFSPSAMASYTLLGLLVSILEFPKQEEQEKVDLQKDN